MRINSLTIGSFAVTATPSDVGTGTNIVLELTGTESPTRRISRFPLPGNHGAFVSNALYGERVIGISIRVVGSTETDLRERIAELAAEINLASVDPSTEVTFTDVDGNIYTVTGYASVMSMGGGFGRRRYDDIAVEIICEDHRIFSGTEDMTTIYLQDTSGGIGIPTVVPISFGAAGGGTATVTNDGNAETCPTIKLNGPLTNPTITSVTKGEAFKYDDAIAAGDYVLINTRTQTVLDQDGNSVIGTADPSIRDFWCLEPGANTVRFEHEGAYNAAATAVISWSSANSSL
jgi:phage-related protein